MERKLLTHLIDWFRRPGRKPLVLRGARQVGKTWLVREFARRQGLELAEVNFEERPNVGAVFDEADPRKILAALELVLGQRIDPARTLLFLDEIQRAPHAFANLRWFFEKLPELPVLATGSLLDFVLRDHSFSMGEEVQYPLLSLPFYLVEQLPRLVRGQ